MEKLFIQSFMDDNGKTFLEVGKGEDFTSVPSEFNVCSNGTCVITITNKNLLNLSKDWGVTESEIQKALQKQFGDTRLLFFIKNLTNEQRNKANY